MMDGFNRGERTGSWLRKHSHISMALLAVLMLLGSRMGLAQTTPSQAAQAILQQSLLAHVGAPGVLPDDLELQGQLTDPSGTRPLRILIKGKDQVRYELGLGPGRRVSIYNGGSGWSGAETSLKPLPDHVAQQRPVEVPFLDLLAELGHPRLKVRRSAIEPIGTTAVYRVGLRLTDPAPERRFLNRPLHQDVDLFIDAGAKLIVRSERLLAAENSMEFLVPWVLEFSDYRQVGPLVLPFRIRSTIGTAYSGVHPSTIVIQSVLVNSGLADAIFRPQ